MALLAGWFGGTSAKGWAAATGLASATNVETSAITSASARRGGTARRDELRSIETSMQNASAHRCARHVPRVWRSTVATRWAIRLAARLARHALSGLLLRFLLRQPRRDDADLPGAL